MNRYALLLNRFLAAQRLGFTFFGTTRGKLPSAVRLGGTTVNLHYPEDAGYILDVVNVWLDDEYGVGKLSEMPGTVVDIGGNIGLFSLWTWSHFPKSRI